MKSKNEYLEYYLSGVIKLNVTDKKNKIKKLQKLIDKIINDPEIDFVKSDSSLTVFNEAEIISAYMSYDDYEN